MEFTAGLMPLETALSQMLSSITPLTAVETLPLVECFGRVLATDVVSPIDVPGFDNSAMDGYAVRLADLQSGLPLAVAGKAFAGQPFHGEWPAGTCIRIMTGAPVPAGCEAVVMQEQTEQTDDGIRFTAEVRAGQNIRLCGEDIAHGAVVFAAGTRLTTAELPVLARSVLPMCRLCVKCAWRYFLPVMSYSCQANRWVTARFMTPTAWPYT